MAKLQGEKACNLENAKNCICNNHCTENTFAKTCKNVRKRADNRF